MRSMHSPAKRFVCMVQRGFNLVELLVAMALMGVVTLACVALYNSSAQSYRTVDSNQDLQAKARYAIEVITQAARMAGYEDRIGRRGAIYSRDEAVTAGSTFYPNGAVYALRGYDNAKLTGSQAEDVTYDGGNNTSDIATNNKSDILTIRYFGSGKNLNGTQPDGTVVDCTGRAHGYPIDAAPGSIPVSMFVVMPGKNNEPELNCVALNTEPSATKPRSRYPILQGVEVLQFAYGIDPDNDQVQYPNRWLNAVDITATQWPLVRWIRVGMVIRGAPGSAQGQLSEPLYPLGKEFTGSATDEGLVFVPPNDGRLRRAFTTVIQVRNAL